MVSEQLTQIRYAVLSPSESVNINSQTNSHELCTFGTVVLFYLSDCIVLTGCSSK